MEHDRLTRAGQNAWAILGIAGVVALVCFAIWQVRVVLPPLVLAATIVFVLNPVVTRLARRMHRAAAAAVTYLAVFLLLIVSGMLLAPLFGSQIDQLRDDWPDIRQNIVDYVDERSAESKVEDWPVKVPTYDELIDEFTPADSSIRDQITRARRFGGVVLHLGLILVLAPVIAFYLLIDLPRTKELTEALIPPSWRADVEVVGHRLNRAMGGYFRGQLAVAFVVGVLCSAGLAIIGLRYAVLVGMIAGLFNLIPLVGPWIGGVPGVIIALTTGSPVKALLVVVVMASVQQIDNHFITPQVMQRAVRLHPAAVMLALLAGGAIAGFFGLLLAVPVTAALRIVASHVWHHHVLGQPLPTIEGGAEPGGVVVAP